MTKNFLRFSFSEKFRLVICVKKKINSIFKALAIETISRKKQDYLTLDWQILNQFMDEK